MKTFDLIVVSSSPVMVLEALKYKKQGLSVCVFDERERIGGAWYVKDLFGYKNVEVGCHFIHNNNQVYDFLNQIESFKLEIMNPQPAVIISSLKNKAKQKNGSFANFKYLVKSFFFENRILSSRQMYIITGISEMIHERSPKKFFEGMKRFFRYTPYYYFKKGCGEFMKNINRLVEEEGLKINYNYRIKDVHIQAGIGGFVEVNGEQVEFKKLLLSKHVKFDSLNINSKIEYERTPWRKKHFVFHIRGKLGRKFSYIDVVNDPFLKRVSNVGIYCDGIDEHHVLLCCDIGPATGVGLHVGVLANEKVDMNNTDLEIKMLIFERLLKLNFILEGAELLNYFVEQFDSDYTPKEKIQELFEESKGVIISIDTTDLGKSIERYKNSWGVLVEE